VTHRNDPSNQVPTRIENVYENPYPVPAPPLFSDDPVARRPQRFPHRDYGSRMARNRVEDSDRQIRLDSPGENSHRTFQHDPE
jgi:hypothetical protein